MTSYTPDPAGLHELALDPDLGKAILARAEQGAAAARRVSPTGQYVARPVTVVAGRRNEFRDGAEVVDEAPDSMGREAQTRALSVTAVAAIEEGNR